MAENKQLPATANPDNLYWIMSENAFMYLPTRTLFKRDAVIRQVGPKVAARIERLKVCSNLFWAPGLPTFMENMAVIDGALFDEPGNNLFNVYKAPDIRVEGDPDQADFWLELGEFLFGEDLHHIIQCLAFKIQHPEVKINHALVFGSYDQGIGKDSWLAPVQRGVGFHNWGNVTAGLAVEWTNRGFTAPILRKVITRISEVHDLGPQRFKFYDMTKDWAAAPPETLLVADKNVKAHHISNVVLPIYSTNHKTDGLYIPEEDRRHAVIWSDRTRADMQESRWRERWAGYGYAIERDDEKRDEYWQGYWKHIRTGADYHVVAYLSQPHLLDGFNPGATPPHSTAWHEIVNANRNPQDGELLDVLDTMGFDYETFEPARPRAVVIDQIAAAASKRASDLSHFLLDKKNSRAIAHRLESVGYHSLPCPNGFKGLWWFNGKRQAIYVQRELTPSEAARAARDLIAELTNRKRRAKAIAGDFDD